MSNLDAGAAIVEFWKLFSDSAVEPFFSVGVEMPNFGSVRAPERRWVRGTARIAPDIKVLGVCVCEGGRG